MLRKICSIGNSQGVSIPKDILEKLHLDIGSKVDVEFDEENGKITVEAVKEETAKAGIGTEFAATVDDFINKYRPALKALSKK